MRDAWDAPQRRQPASAPPQAHTGPPSPRPQPEEAVCIGLGARARTEKGQPSGLTKRIAFPPCRNRYLMDCRECSAARLASSSTETARYPRSEPWRRHLGRQLHGLRHTDVTHVLGTFRHPCLRGRTARQWSGRRESNPRHSAWESEKNRRQSRVISTIPGLFMAWRFIGLAASGNNCVGRRSAKPRGGAVLRTGD